MFNIKKSDSTRVAWCRNDAITLGTTDVEFPIFVAPANCILRQISWVPSAAVTQSDTNKQGIYIYNKGAAGTSSNEIISGNTTNAASGGTAISAFNELDLETYFGTNFSTTYNKLSAGDVVSFKNISGGAGVTLASGLLKVVYELTDPETFMRA